SEGETRKLLEQLMFAGELPLSMPMLSEKFNRSRFFEEKFYPLSLYYLGMTTFRDRYSMGFPDLTVKTIFTDYFNEVERIDMKADCYVGMFRRFTPKFVKVYADVYTYQMDAVKKFIGEVQSKAFPSEEHTFTMKEEAIAELRKALKM
ncbi:MAG: 3-methyl-2-oxobutanoate hydroxymethyltransferase, partial [Spirochaetota bacterium]